MPHNEGNNKAVPQKIYHPRLFIYSAPFLVPLFSFSVPILCTVCPSPVTVKAKRHVMCLHNALRKTPSSCMSAIFSLAPGPELSKQTKRQAKRRMYLLKALEGTQRAPSSQQFMLFVRQLERKLDERWGLIIFTFRGGGNIFTLLVDGFQSKLL